MPNHSDRCLAIDPLVTPYVDGHLESGDRRTVDEHLQRCAPCASRVAAERAVRDLIHERRATLARSCAPDALHGRCAELARLNDDARPTSRADVFGAARRLQPTEGARGHQPGGAARGFSQASWRTRLAPLALAASLTLLVGAAFLYQLTESSSRVLAAELAADHVKCFALNSMLHTHDSPTAVESAMVSGFGWRMQLPDTGSVAGLELVGSRPCLYGEGKIAHIMYRHNGEPVSLFMLPRRVRTQEVVDVLGHEAAIWCAGDRTFVLLARKPRQEVDRLVAAVQASLR